MDQSMPRYLQLKQQLLQRIRSGDFQPGDRVPSEHQLARMAGVSRITAKQALSELAREGWVYRVRGKGTFVSERPRPPERGPVQAIGVVVPYLRSAYSTGVVMGVESVLVEAGYHLVFRSAGTYREEEESVRSLSEAGVHGIIVWPAVGQFVNAEIVRLYLSRFPIVLIDRFYRGLPIDCAQSDNLRGGYLVTRHLLDLDHKHIAFVAGDERLRNVTSVEERHLGFQTALHESGVAASDLLTWPAPDVPDWCEWLAAQLSEQPDVTALVAENDEIALKLLVTLDELGVPVPGRISVTGFDDEDIAATAPVPLTTVRQDAVGLGKAAARLLLDRIEGRTPATHRQQVILPVELTVRESTDRPGTLPTLRP